MPSTLLAHLDLQDADPFETVFAQAPILMHSIDSDGRLINVSRFLADFLGYEREEMIGKRSIDFLTEESRRHAVETVLPRFFREGRVDGVCYDLVRKTGEAVAMVMAATSQIDENGDFTRSLAVLYDNTETRRAQAMLARSQKLETIGQLAGGVAHDFNNLLTVVQGNLELMRDLDDAEEAERCRQDALRAVRRGADLTQQLLSFGRRARLAPEELSPDDALADACGLMKRLLPANIRMELRVAAGLWPVRLDRSRLEAAILNLGVNARDAMPMGGRLRMSLRNRVLDAAEAAKLSEHARAGRFVALEVSDEGVGMNREIAERACDPFFTTKPAGAGSGLGLSMVQGFVVQSGGGLEIESRCGDGATVRLLLPAQGVGEVDGDLGDARAAAASPPVDAASHAAKVLVVEDQEELRRIVVAQLRASGHRVLEATSGDVARSCLLAGLKPDLILTDLEMPGVLQGADMAVFARGLDPAVAIVALSGRVRPEDAARLPGDVEPLSKPVSRERLLDAVRIALERRADLLAARPDVAGRLSAAS
ncbi:MAG: ATP-binding protein [Pseudomonadota bacterium]